MNTLLSICSYVHCLGAYSSVTSVEPFLLTTTQKAAKLATQRLRREKKANETKDASMKETLAKFSYDVTSLTSSEDTQVDLLLYFF